MRCTAIVGTGQTKYITNNPEYSVPDLVNLAVTRALDDAGLKPKDIDAVVFGTAPETFEGINSPDKWAADAAAAWGKPFMRINTGGNTGASTADAAVNHVASGVFDTVLAVGLQRIGQTPDAQRIFNFIYDPIWAKDFFLSTSVSAGMGMVRSMQEFGYDEWHIARVSKVQHDHGCLNPYAHLQMKITEEDVMKSRVITWPLRLLHCCPRSEGAVAVVMASEQKARKITSRPAWVNGLGSVTIVSVPGEREGPEGGMEQLRGSLKKAYAMAGITEPRKQIDVVEPYVPFASGYVTGPYTMGFTDNRRDCAKLVEQGFGEMTGEVPFTPSGGVLCSNPIGATALVRVAEAAIQVMGKGGNRQVSGKGRGGRVRAALAMGGGGQSSPGTAGFSTAFVLGAEPS